MTLSDYFGEQVLEGTTFTVDWQKTTTEKKHGKNGGDYDVPVITCQMKGYQTPLQVSITKRDYDTLRLLKAGGINTFSCTRGLALKEGGFAPFIFAGATPF